jgi:aminoglycoside 6'-N-acetyltransferase
MGLRLHGRLTEVRPATDDDADLLVAWHADPDVSRYWDDETFTREQLLERLRRPDVDAYVVEAGGSPVGYIQAWWEDDEPRSGGIDMFLVPSARGRGYGPDAARALTESLLASGWTRVTVDPYVSNEPAIRAWRRAGFVELERHGADDGHPSAWVLMEFQSASGSS